MSHTYTIKNRKASPFASFAHLLGLSLGTVMTFLALVLIPVKLNALESSKDAHQFVDNLMSKMTIDEKIGQLNLLTSDWDVTGPSIRGDYMEQIKAGKVGAIFNAYTASYTEKLQKVAVEQTRLGIPLLFGYDVIHGHRTIFPISLGETASWDLAAIENAARVAATEAAAEGIHWTFAPMVDVSRDPRWGRVSEGSGEDVFLTSEIARARVNGFQGDDLSKEDTILACAKHFAAYGAAQAGRDYHTTDMSLRELHETYLPPFKAAIEANVQTFMTAFNDLNGVPATANTYLLDDILRKQWGFEGFVVSDYTSVNELVPHGFAKNEADAGLLSIKAGLDMDMQGSVYDANLKNLVAENKIDEAILDRSVKRILLAKYHLGLFSDPYRYSSKERQKNEIYKPSNLAAARDMARKSMVLLSNKNNILPLKKDKLKIAVVGPLANSKADMIGSWSAAGDRKEKPITLLEALNSKEFAGNKIYFDKGASYEFDSASETNFKKAIKLAKKSDVIIAAMGERWDMTGEAASRTSLTLPGNQTALLKELKKLGKPIILVLFSGRPNAIGWELENVDAILHAWYPGTMGGPAIADVLYGDYNPSGKLPMTFPRNVGQIPIFYNMKNTGRPYFVDGPEQKYRSRYLVTPNTPLFPFGFGLSYTQFKYDNIRLSKKTISKNDVLTVTVDVTNTGKRQGEEVVQLYVQDKFASITRPVKQLKGFKKIVFNANETKEVSFNISPKDLAFYGQDMKLISEKGEFNIMIGGDSENNISTAFKLSETISF